MAMQPDIRLIDFMNRFGGMAKKRRSPFLVNGMLLTGFATGFGLAEAGKDWRMALLQDLSTTYLEEEVTGEISQDERGQRLDRLFRELGRRLADSGAKAVPVRHIASLALLGAELAPPDDEKSTAPDLERPSSSEVVAEPVSDELLQTRSLTKGQEGFRQAVEQFQELPLSERMVMTGDVTSGVQMATVSGDSPHLTSVFGRTRVNFTLRALPARSQVWDEGYFFVQIGAAGGPFDSSAVGGPQSFTSFNDVASDRSRFNEPIARGNLYLGKAFYEQGLRWGDNRLSARAGVLDISDYFDTNEFANNEMRQFVNSAFVNGAAYKTGVVAPGLVGEYERPLSHERLRGVVLRVGYAVSRTERAFTSPLWTTEAELRTVLGDYPGNWRIGMTLGNVAGEGGVRGIYLSADQWVTPRVGVFGRYGMGNSGPGSLVFGPVRNSYSGGIQWRFAREGRPDSALGFAFSQTFGINDGESFSSEKVLEAYYRWQVTRSFAVTPDFQLIFGSGGRSAEGTHGVAGARVHVSF